MKGGKREGAGRKSKYGEKTKNITIRIPESKVILFRSLVKRWLKRFEE